MGIRIISFIVLFFLSQALYSQCLQANIILLIDWSGSELGNEIPLAKSALLFVDELPISPDQVQIGVMTFANDPVVITNLSSDKFKIKSSIVSMSSIYAHGGTFLSGAMDMAIEELKSNDIGTRNIIILVSDGEIDNVNLVVNSVNTAQKTLALDIFAVQITSSSDESAMFGYTNLVRITGYKENIVQSGSRDIVEALKRLNLCN